MPARHRSIARRRLVAAGVSLLLVATVEVGLVRAQSAIEDDGLVRVARLHYRGGGDWYANPSSLPNLQGELSARLGLPVAEREATVTLDDERLYRYPMLYVTGHGTFDLNAGDVERLRRYLDAGGFLWIDDNYGLDESVRSALARLYPEQELAAIGSDHPIYSSYYDLPGLPKIHEHDGDPAQGFGILVEGRMAVFYSWSSDVGDGLEDPAVHGNPPAVREAAMQMAINVCVFALTQP